MSPIRTLNRPRRSALGLALCLVLGLAAAPSVGAFVYWANNGDTTIGRANLDGTGANQSFVAGTARPAGVAVDGAHVYWANFGQGDGTTIGRANLDGTGVNQSFIGGATNPCGPAVDGAHVYWANNHGFVNTIGRANLDGTGSDQNFITGANQPCGVAVDGAHVYWANYVGGSGTTIGRANLDGSAPNQSFITGANGPIGVAVNGTHIFWANVTGGTIGRANLDGTGVNQSFITGASAPAGVAVDAAHVYWANQGGTTIGRANLDGTDVNQSFITGANAPYGVAVDAGVLPPPDADGDGVPDTSDNCASVSNVNQQNTDGDPQGDVCDGDDDNDGVADASDGCPTQAAATATGCPATLGGSPAPTPTPTPTAAALPPAEQKLVDATPGQVATLIGLPSARKCVSRRNFPIHMRAPTGVRFTSATVRIGNKKLKVRKIVRGFKAQIDLRGFPKGRFKVKIRLVTARGSELRATRTYRTCVPKKRLG